MTKNNKTLVAIDITGVISDDEHIQALLFRDVLKEMFADNPEALKKLDATFSPDDEKCVEWYYDNLKGKVEQQRDIISKNIYPISEEERNKMRDRIYERQPDPEPFDGIIDCMKALKNRKDVDVVFISAGSSGKKKLISFGIEKEDSSNIYIKVKDRTETLQDIVEKGGYDKEKVINIVSSTDGIVHGFYNVAATQFCRDHCSKDFADSYDEKMMADGADVVVKNATEIEEVVQRRIEKTNGNPDKKVEVWKREQEENRKKLKEDHKQGQQAETAAKEPIDPKVVDAVIRDKHIANQ